MATLTQSQGVQFTRIYSYGAARGDLVVPNDELIAAIDSSDEWIQQRTGIITRTRASAGILAIDLAVLLFSAMIASFAAFVTLGLVGIVQAQVAFVPERTTTRIRTIPARPKPPPFAPTVSVVHGGVGIGLIGRF